MAQYAIPPLVLLFIFLISPIRSEAQQIDDTNNLYTFEFTGETLSWVLETIANETEADLVYDPAIIEGYSVYKRIRNQPVSNVLSEILEGTGLDYVILSSGTYVVVRAVRRPASYGTFAGKIYDIETGEPLPGATVMLANAGGGTSSNSSGYFNLGRLKSGTYQIIFSYVGYNPVSKTVTIPPENNIREQVGLHSQRIDINPIVVSAHQPFMPVQSDSEINTESRTEWDIGSRTPDIIRNLSLFSGIQYGLPMTDIHIQGGQRGDHRLFLDGVPVYNPYSFGRLYSAFSPYSIGRISVKKAGHDAGSGSYIAGKINLNHDLANNTGEHAMIQADPVNTNIRVNLGDQDNDFRLLAAFRSSFWGWFQDPALSGAIRDWDFVDPLTYNILINAEDDSPRFETATNQTDVQYHDIHTAGLYDIDDYQRISFSFYQGQNAVETDLLAADRFNPLDNRMFSRDTYNWRNLITQIQYDWLASPRTDLQVKASYSSNKMNHRYAMFDNREISEASNPGSEGELFQNLVSLIGNAPSQNDRNEIRHFIFNTDLDYTFSPRFSLSGGLQFDQVYSNFNLTGLFYLPTLNQQNTSLFSTWLHGQWNLGSHLRLSAGSRFTYFTDGGSFYPEPRASLQYDRNNSKIGYWSIKLSGGVYRQYINQFEITNVGPSSLVPDFTIWTHDNTLEQPLSYNSNLSFFIEPADGTSIRFEGFAKIQPSAYITSYSNLLLEQDLERTGLEAFAEVTDAQAFGGGFRFQQDFFRSNLQLLLGYDLSISEVNFESQFGRKLPAPWNEPHRLQGRILARATPELSFVAKWQGVFGRTWGFRQAYYNFLVPHNFTSVDGYNFLNPEDDRLFTFYQVDFAVIYQPKLGNLNTEVRLDLINILNRHNTIDWNLHPVHPSSGNINSGNINNEGFQEFEIRERRMPGFNPSVSIKVGF